MKQLVQLGLHGRHLPLESSKAAGQVAAESPGIQAFQNFRARKLGQTARARPLAGFL
ncbi:MAG TPA: hypothetical protein VMG35_25075 [Bryobacteraceae bacterium]|nr:hypothetical protein [Bryobacteraceae bacterium]